MSIDEGLDDEQMHGLVDRLLAILPDEKIYGGIDLWMIRKINEQMDKWLIDEGL